MTGEGDALFLLPLEGAVGALARAISDHTGAPEGATDLPRLRQALAGAFPELGEPQVVEGCTTHPALTVKLRVPGLNREAAKVVFLPTGGGLEVRLRGEVPGGSYRRETLERIVSFLVEVEVSLGGHR